MILWKSTGTVECRFSSFTDHINARLGRPLIQDINLSRLSIALFNMYYIQLVSYMKDDSTGATWPTVDR